MKERKKKKLTERIIYFHTVSPFIACFKHIDSEGKRPFGGTIFPGQFRACNDPDGYNTLSRQGDLLLCISFRFGSAAIKSVTF